MFSPCLLLVLYSVQPRPLRRRDAGTSPRRVGTDVARERGRGSGWSLKMAGKNTSFLMEIMWKYSPHHAFTDVEHNMCQNKSMPLTRASHWKSHLRSSIKHGNTLWSSNVTVAYQPLYRGFPHEKLNLVWGFRSQQCLYAGGYIFYYFCFTTGWGRAMESALPRV